MTECNKATENVVHRNVYATCYPLGTGSGAVRGSTPGGDVMGVAMCECGDVLAEHYSSSEGFARHDMGVTSDWKHEYYLAHCGEGFNVQWVARDSEEWKRTLALNHQRYPREKSA
jgi:hypothetical protein